MAELGHEVHVLTYPFGDDLPVSGLQIHRIPQLGWRRQIQVGPTLQKPFMDILMVVYACRVIWKYKCNIIHSHNYEGQLVGMLSKILTGRPLLYNAVTSMSAELPSYHFIRPAFLARWLATFLDWLIPKLSDHILALTPELRDMLVKRGTSPERITVVPAGIFPEMFAKADPTRFRNSLGLGEARVILYAGTIDGFQRVDLLVDSLARLDQALSDVILLIVCPFTRQDLRKKLDEQAGTLGIAHRIRWIDSHPLEDLPDYLAVADVAVMPRPQCPGHPIKLLNYMGAGLPIVVSAGGAKGIRHLHNGFIFRDEDVDHMAEGITTLLQDKALAGRLGREARQTILDDYDWRVLCQKIGAIYDNIIANRRPTNGRQSAKPPSIGPGRDPTGYSFNRQDKT